MSADFTNRARLGFFLAWLPLTGLLVALLAVRSGLGWLESTAFAVPLCGLYALLCRSSWYVARATPVRTSGLPRLVASHGMAALAASGLWLLAGAGLAQPFATATRHALMARLPLLYGVGVTYYLLGVVYHYLVLSMEESRVADKRVAEAHALAREAELKALRAQLNPHFLFNSLNSIAALTAVEPDLAREMTVTLSEFLRGSLRVGDRPLISLSEELALARHYLDIERIRFADRLEVTEEIEPECLDCQLPPLLLQPLVENAVKHGVAGQLEGGWVRLAARLEGDRLRVTVENSFESDAPAPQGTGHGLAIVSQRLAAHYRDDASLHTRTSQDEPPTHRAELHLPAHRSNL